MHATVLVVDDDESIRDLLCQVLRMSEFDVLGADTGLAALAVVEHRPVDLMVLDVMLPDLDSFAVARRLRAAGNRVPVLFLTARDTVQDRIIGLRAGGDDYVSKPFSLEEVVLRVQAILRRVEPPGDGDERIVVADLYLDAEAHRVSRSGQEVVLSATEFSMLEYLMRNAGQVVSKSQIIAAVWGAGDARDGRVVETFVSQLRRKIDACGPPLIHTVRGVGYTLRPDRVP